MVKQILHPKTDYLELLLENDDEGLTVTEIEEIFDDASRQAIYRALRGLRKKGCVRREEGEEEFRYWITDAGILKYDYLMKKKEGLLERD